MLNAKIGRHELQIYDNIEQLPIVRFHKYQKLLLIDAGVGSTIADFDVHVEKAMRYINAKNHDSALKELQNLRQLVYFMQAATNPKLLSFVPLVASIDGEPVSDLTDDAIARTFEKINDVSYGELAETLTKLQTTIDEQLNIYFPGFANSGKTKEYYTQIRRRTVAILMHIANGDDTPARQPDVEKITDDIINSIKPRNFTGAQSVEISSDKSFENLCIFIGNQLNANAKNFTVLEFYNALEYLQNQANEKKTNKK